AEAAAAAAREGQGVRVPGLAIRALARACVPLLSEAATSKEGLAETLLAIQELADRRLDALLKAYEEDAARRVVEAENEAARAAERAVELKRANDSLRRSEARGQHRAEQIALLASVAHRIAGILEPERLMEETARMVQGRMGHTYVAVVVLDDEGILVGRWAGKEGVTRRSAGRAQGPPAGIIGRALRKKAPQVVPDVDRDPDYHRDVAGTRSEMVVPLMEAGEAVGAIDFQSDRPAAFDLDSVVSAEVLAEFLIVAFRNARLYAANRRN
ncbi:MAG TPA: GAF domain-containing protein, partial [Vicinamibacteria bacterium]|nr:GAF domain-containing protein [Vicinamibacteria bacterium]